MKWDRPIIAIGHTHTLIEYTGEIIPNNQLGMILPTLIPSIVCGVELYDKIMPLNRLYEKHPDWNMKITPVTRRKYLNNQHIVNVGSYRVNFFGFKRPSKKLGNLFFHCVDLGTFGCNTRDTCQRVMEVSDEVRDFCKRHSLPVPSGRGSIGASLIRQFRTDKERTPRFINDLCRSNLPGNHYSLGIEQGRKVDRATYLDQSGAHHRAAAMVNPPSPTSTMARGFHRELEKGQVKAWLRSPDAISEFRKTHHGLVAASVFIPTIPRAKQHLYPRFFENPGRTTLFFYSNEWEVFDEIGGLVVDYIIAGWTATETDDYLKRFSNFAQSELQDAPKWVKASLLSAYGALATRPTRHESYFTKVSPRRFKEGNTVKLPHGSYSATMNVVQTREEMEPWYVNTMHRGMIEAQTRLDVLKFARVLENQYKIKVYCIYADAIICEPKQLPLLPDGWRVDKEMTDVHFIHPNSFTSRERTRLPGLPRQLRARRDSARRGAGLSPLEPSEFDTTGQGTLL